MKAAIYTKYGPPEVLHVAEVPTPSIQENEVLIKVHATTVNSGDRHMRKADPFVVRFFAGLFKPKQQILGTTFAGEVASVGSQVQNFVVGNKVFGATGMKMGCYAQYVALPSTDVIATTPANLSDQDAAAIPFGALTALYFLRKANIQPGHKVLIYGASGAVGTAAVQLATSMGAEVTGVCSTGNLELVTSLGAHHVIDYTQEKITSSGERYDVIFDTVGKASMKDCLSILADNGTLLQSAAGLGDMLRSIGVSLTSKKKVVSGLMKETQTDIEYIVQLIQQGKLKPVIDTVYTLDQIAQAHHHVQAGHKKGNIVVTL